MVSEAVEIALTKGSPLVVTIFGVVTGLEYRLLLAAFWGALYSVRSSSQRGFIDRGWKVTTGTLFGAWAAKSLAAFVVSVWPAFEGAVGLELVLAFVWGMYGLRWLDRWAEKRIDEAGR